MKILDFFLFLWVIFGLLPFKLRIRIQQLKLMRIHGDLDPDTDPDPKPCRRLPGKKMLVCDNLSSHISLEVISLCRENNIEYVCLPPNSTDKMQPLDVGIFGPMKHHWRKQLKAYSERDLSAKLLQKTEFPRMLQELMESISPKDLPPKAFEKCGLEIIFTK
jgi:hypothetical protein